MDVPPSVSADDLAATPPSVLALIRWLTVRVDELEAEVAELKARLGKDSTNSSKPPSATHPHAKPPPKKKKRGRKRGGQPGHQKHQRPLLPSDQCTQVELCIPTECDNCGQELTGKDLDPQRHQVWEIPEIQPLVTEYQLHSLRCSCGCTTRGVLPPGVTSCQAGPRLISFVALLMGSFRQSKRRVAEFLSTLLNQPASVGWIVKLQNHAAAAMQPAYEELATQLPREAVLFGDESPTKEGPKKSWVWTFVARSFTLFANRTSRGGDVVREFLGERFAGVIHCDRARMYWQCGRLQWCWAHLKRDFQSLIDNSCTVTKRLGHDLMRAANKMFDLWRRVRDGTMTRKAFRKQMRPIQMEIEDYLLRGIHNGREKGFCKELWKHRAWLWTFVDVEGVEPTNNVAERALRHAVIWRKLSFGTQSAAGSRFVERILTVVETCRRQGRNTLAWLTAAVTNYRTLSTAPPLLCGV